MTSLFEYLITALFIAVLVLLSNPFMFWMPSMFQMTALAFVAVLSAVYMGFILREHGGDERDIDHRQLAGRAAFLASVGVLTVALLVQGLTHTLDPWIPGALAATLLAKVIARAWADRVR